MKTAVYRFGACAVDTLARELRHAGEAVDLPASAFDCLVYLIEQRSRPVGRDELIAAVWGRAEVSETLLNHTILRLRKTLGDSAREQRMIRTAARYGYRWVADVTVESRDGFSAAAAVDAAPDAGDEVTAPSTGDAGAAPRQSGPAKWPRRTLGVALALVLALGLAAATWWALRAGPAVDTAGVAADAPRVMVLPADVDAPPEWAWLRLGMMDLIANHLRAGGLAVAPSEMVVHLPQASAAAPAAPMPPDANGWTLRPRIGRADGAWQVTLTLAQPQGPLEAVGRSGEAMAAGRQAADRLLAALGHAAPTLAGDTPDIALQELLQRTKAATLADQLDLARSLIERAPPALAQAPDLQWMMALVDSRAGLYDAAVQRLERLLDGTADHRDDALRIRTLNFVGSLYFRRTQYDRALDAYEEAIALAAQGPADSAARGLAYAGRGLVALVQSRFAQGTADLGRARLLYQAANNALGLAQVDMNLAGAAVLRGQPAAALPLLESAIARFRTLASQEEYVVSLAVLTDVHRSLLDFPAALAVTERFWPPERHIANRRLQWRLQLTRAETLADLGRSAESRALTQAVLAGADAPDDEEIRGRAQGLLARIALAHGDCREALARSEAAATNVPLRTDGDSYAEVMLVRLRALRCAGRADEAAGALTDLDAWSRSATAANAQTQVALARAEQARASRGHAQALVDFGQAMRLAGEREVPNLEVEVSRSYLCTLVALGRLDEAAAVSGRIAPWADRDLRAAWAQVLTYRALDQADAWSAAAEQARRLTGERPLPDARCP